MKLKQAATSGLDRFNTGKFGNNECMLVVGLQDESPQELLPAIRPLEEPIKGGETPIAKNGHCAH